MNALFDILINFANLILGAVVGYYFNDWKEKRREESKKKKVEDENIRLYDTFKNEVDLVATRGIVQIGHGTPYFEPAAMTTSVDNNMVCYYPIPETDGLKEELASLGFAQDNQYKLDYIERYNCLSPKFPYKAKFDEAFRCFGDYAWDDKTKAEIAEIAVEAGKEFIRDLKEGKQRFNGSMLGVKEIVVNSDPRHDERPTANVKYYISDYFTFRVFAKFYLKHIDEFRALQSEPGAINLKMLQQMSMPFLSSFGVAAVIIGTASDIHNCEEKLCATDTIISGQRGGNVIVDRNRIHFGMNEAFSYSMDSEHNNTPTYDHCVLRGIREELLGFKLDTEKGKKYEQFIGTPYFLDFIFDSNKCEMGVTAYIRLKFSLNEEEGFTNQSLNDLYNEAKDRTLETEKLLFTPMSDLDIFIREHGQEMSAGYFVALNNLKRRLNVGLI